MTRRALSISSYDTDGCAPKAGERKPNPELAATFRRLGEHGAKDGFYTGPIADAIVAAVGERGRGFSPQPQPFVSLKSTEIPWNHPMHPSKSIDVKPRSGRV
jgi:type VI protein secretion system component Hcp